MVVKLAKSAFCLSLSLLAGLSFDASPSYADDTDDGKNTSFLMWQMPTTGISFPVYVYENGAQTGYLYSTSQQAFVGAYDPSSTTASYDLYYQDTSGDWHGCTIALKNGSIENTTKTCPGTVINPPVSSSNIYTVGPGAIAWPKATSTPTTHEAVNYSKRKITFINNTDHANIRIGQHCTVSDNPNNKNCANNQKLFEIAQNDKAVFYVDGDSSTPSNSPLFGLTSNGFTVTAYQHENGGDWVQTGGYGKGQRVYATKIEFTHPAVKHQSTNGKQVQIPTGATNFDISAVDGYNISVSGYPEKPTYCTYTVPPEGSNVLGAGKYSENSVLASINANKTICESSSQLPSGYDKNNPKPWNLVVEKNGQYQGCKSPCSYATENKDPDAAKFCCSKPTYHSPAACDQQPGVIGANNSTYVTNLKSPITNHVYRFAYDDAIGDFACPAETNFVVVFAP